MMLPTPIKDTDSSLVLPDQTCQRFTLSEIQSATNNFDETLVIGRGGFGNVYKCSIGIGLAREVAVKRLHSMSNQGSHEFEAEVEVLSKLRHGNLVSLIGYCNEGNEMALVYEFMPNGTLEDHLRKPELSLSWLQLLKICIGAARGLDYLHMGTSTQHGVIHRDVKSSNILLDAKFAARISDFGLAKVSLIDQTQTHVSTAVKGTFGYMDPCYFYTGQLTRKSDVYAFGVVLFEVLSGKKAVDSTLDEDKCALVSWVQHQIKQGKLNQILDPRLMGQISKKCLKEFASIAGRCIHTQPKRRPTMAEVVVKLESILSHERESANSLVDEEGFIYKLRSLFTGKVDTVIGSKSDLTEVNAATRSKSDSSEVDVAIGSKSDLSEVDVARRSKSDLIEVDAAIGSKSDLIEVDAAIENNINPSFRPFTYDELERATTGFKDWDYSPTLDEFIYKGWVDERTYAPTQSCVGLAMYVRKMVLLTHTLDIKLQDINHPNLVKFLGYCLNNHQLFSVYEVISGITLDKYLYGDPGTISLSWIERLKIAIGAAEGLFYLHKRNQAAYSQFKTSLILVDKGLNARLSDFAFDPYTFQSHAYYAAPELLRYHADVFYGQLPWQPPKDGFAVKSEIYAFRVVLLQILTGMKVYDDRRPPGKKNLVEWANPLLADEMNMRIIVDVELQHNNYPPNGAFMLAQLTSNCLQPKQENRPSMEEILQVLSDAQNRAVYDRYAEEGLKGQVPPPEIAGVPGGVTFFSTGGGFSSVRQKAAPIERILSCTLEELYKGTVKKIKITRDIVDIGGKTMTVEKILSIPIQPGWQKGTKITFTEKGNEQPNTTPADLVFTIDEKPHCTFTRDGNDLVMTQWISKAEALTDYTVHLTALDGRNLTVPVPVNNVCHPEYTVVPKEGMPISKDPTKRGNLRIKCSLKSQD